MKKLKIATIVLSSFLLFACNDKAKKDTTDTTVVPETKIHQHSDTDSIQLNNGKKWKVDANMMVHIRNIEKDVAAFDNKKPENYQALITNLKANLDLLTADCTMKGQAHDELHKWLLPFIDEVDDFSKDKSNIQFNTIQHSLITFNTYFE